MLTKHISAFSNEVERSQGDEPGTMLDFLLGSPIKEKEEDSKFSFNL